MSASEAPKVPCMSRRAAAVLPMAVLVLPVPLVEAMLLMPVDEAVLPVPLVVAVLPVPVAEVELALLVVGTAASFDPELPPPPQAASVISVTAHSACDHMLNGRRYMASTRLTRHRNCRLATASQCAA
jgi:hypothetical protein